MTQLKIKVTKEILEKSKYCTNDVGTNCAIALAVRDVFPYAWVEEDAIWPFSLHPIIKFRYSDYVDLPLQAVEFINLFDGSNADDRPFLPELEFTIDIPDAVIEQINIDEIRPLLINHPTLELVEC